MARANLVQQILATAEKQFWKHGLKRVSIEEICTAAGVSKMTFYRHFKNKTELAILVFDGVVDKGVAEFTTLLARARTSEDLLENLLRYKQQSVAGMSREFLNDFYTHPQPAIRKHVEDRTRQEWRAIMKQLKKAQAAGLLRRDLNLAFLFQLLMHLNSLLTDEKLWSSFKKPQALILETARMLAYGLSPREIRIQK